MINLLPILTFLTFSIENDSCNDLLHVQSPQYLFMVVIIPYGQVLQIWKTFITVGILRTLKTVIPILRVEVYLEKDNILLKCTFIIPIWNRLGNVKIKGSIAGWHSASVVWNQLMYLINKHRLRSLDKNYLSKLNQSKSDIKLLSLQSTPSQDGTTLSITISLFTFLSTKSVYFQLKDLLFPSNM